MHLPHARDMAMAAFGPLKTQILPTPMQILPTRSYINWEKEDNANYCAILDKGKIKLSTAGK